MTDLYYCGEDIGQAVDPTAIAIVQVVPPPQSATTRLDPRIIANRRAHGLDPLTGEPLGAHAPSRPSRPRPIYRCGHLERLPLNTPYPAVITYTRRTLAKLPGRAELILDLTGVGRACGDLFEAERLFPVKVTITAGDGSGDHYEKGSGIHHVSKLSLVSTVQTLLHDGRLEILKSLPEAAILRAELQDFRAVATDSGRWTFGARSGQHDDLVLALALACWRARSGGWHVPKETMQRIRRMGRRKLLGDP